MVVYATTILFSALALYFLWIKISATFYEVEAEMKQRKQEFGAGEQGDSDQEGEAFDLPRRSKESEQDLLSSSSDWRLQR